MNNITDEYLLDHIFSFCPTPSLLHVNSYWRKILGNKWHYFAEIITFPNQPYSTLQHIIDTLQDSIHISTILLSASQTYFRALLWFKHNIDPQYIKNHIKENIDYSIEHIQYSLRPIPPFLNK